MNEDPANQFDLIFKTLEWLCRKTMAMMEDPGYLEIYREVFGIRKPAVPEKLLDLYEKSKSKLRVKGDGCNVYLPPLWKKSNIVPLLWIRCNFAKESPELRIYAEVYSRASGEIRGVGFRFETPESSADEMAEPNSNESPSSGANSSRHDYWHVQLTNDTVHNGPRWVPDHVPCMPVAAHCPVSLVLYFLRSFYEKETIAKIVTYANIPGICLQSLHTLGLM